MTKIKVYFRSGAVSNVALNTLGQKPVEADFYESRGFTIFTLPTGTRLTVNNAVIETILEETE